MHPPIVRGEKTLSVNMGCISINILSILFSTHPLAQNKAVTLRNAMAQTLIFKLLTKWLVTTRLNRLL